MVLIQLEELLELARLPAFKAASDCSYYELEAQMVAEGVFRRKMNALLAAIDTLDDSLLDIVSRLAVLYSVELLAQESSTCCAIVLLDLGARMAELMAPEILAVTSANSVAVWSRVKKLFSVRIVAAQLYNRLKVMQQDALDTDSFAVIFWGVLTLWTAPDESARYVAHCWGRVLDTILLCPGFTPLVVF